MTFPAWMTNPPKWDQNTLDQRAVWQNSLPNPNWVSTDRSCRMPMAEIDLWVANLGKRLNAGKRQQRGARFPQFSGPGISPEGVNRRYDAYTYVRKQLHQVDARAKAKKDGRPIPTQLAQTNAAAAPQPVVAGFMPGPPTTQVVATQVGGNAPQVVAGPAPHSVVAGFMPGLPAQQQKAPTMPVGIVPAPVAQGVATQGGGFAQQVVAGPSAIGVAQNPYPHQYPNFTGAGSIPQLPAQQAVPPAFFAEMAQPNMAGGSASGVAQDLGGLDGFDMTLPHQPPTLMRPDYMSQWLAQPFDDGLFPWDPSQPSFESDMSLTDQLPMDFGAVDPSPSAEELIAGGALSGRMTQLANGSWVTVTGQPPDVTGSGDEFGLAAAANGELFVGHETAAQAHADVPAEFDASVGMNYIPQASLGPGLDISGTADSVTPWDNIDWASLDENWPGWYYEPGVPLWEQ